MNIRRNTITGHCSVIILLHLLILVVLLGGCREMEPKSEVEQFMERYRSLEASVYIDTLQGMIDAPPPTNLFAAYELGNIYYSAAGDTARALGWQDSTAGILLETARSYFEQAVALDSTFVPALVNLGSLWDDRAQRDIAGRSSRNEREQKRVVAEKFYLQALRHAPDDETARCNLGSLYLDLRRPTEAVAQFQHVLDRNPDSALAHYNLAIMFAEEKMFKEATVEFKAAAESDPDGDIGGRARDNVKVLNDLQNASMPKNLRGGGSH